MIKAFAGNDEAVFIDVDKQIDEIEKMLGNLSNKAPAIMKNALNSVARQVRKSIVKDAQGEYEMSAKMKAKMKATKAASVKSATANRMMATILSVGSMSDLMEFMVTPTAISNGQSPSGYAAKVLKSSGLKHLNGDPKPFITQFQSGHIAIVTRLSQNRLPVKKLLSPSVPHMLNNDKVREEAEALTYQLLPNEIEKQIDKLLKRMATSA